MKNFYITMTYLLEILIPVSAFYAGSFYNNITSKNNYMNEISNCRDKIRQIESEKSELDKYIAQYFIL